MILLRKVKQWYAPLLDRCLRHPRLVALVTLLVAVPAIALGFASAAISCRNWMRGVPSADRAPAEAALEEVDR